MEILGEIIDVRKLHAEERKEVLDKFFEKYLCCEGNSGRAHNWIGHKYVESVRAWHDSCKYCGRHRIHQTVGNMLILDSSLSIEKALIRNCDFKDLSQVRKQILAEAGFEGVHEQESGALTHP